MINLYHGDCLELMKGIEDQSVDMILCDLPYGSTACSWDTVIPFDALWEQYNRIIKDNGAIVLFGGEPFSSMLRISNLKMYRYDWQWEKDKGANWQFANIQPFKVCEYICVFYKKQPIYNPQKTKNPKGVELRSLYPQSKISDNVRDLMGKSLDDKSEGEIFRGKNYEPDKLLPRSRIYFARDRKPLHPTQKPVALLEYLIKTYTNENDLVLDNCMGSGSIGVASKNTNRNFIGIEKDEKYFEIAKKRIETHQI